jgi:hypothetical protein
VLATPLTRQVDCPIRQSGSITQTRTSTCPGPTTSGWIDAVVNCVAQIDAVLEAAFDLLLNSVAGHDYAQLLLDNHVPIRSADRSPSTAYAQFSFCPNRTSCTPVVYINTATTGGFTSAALAAYLSHEAMHADFYFDPNKWVAQTLADHPELTNADIHINRIPFNSAYAPYDSIDQEYHAFSNQALLWKEIKGTEVNAQLNVVVTLYDMGEADLKAAIRPAYLTLPEY